MCGHTIWQHFLEGDRAYCEYGALADFPTKEVAAIVESYTFYVGEQGPETVTFDQLGFVLPNP